MALADDMAMRVNLRTSARLIVVLSAVIALWPTEPAGAAPLVPNEACVDEVFDTTDASSDEERSDAWKAAPEEPHAAASEATDQRDSHVTVALHRLCPTYDYRPDFARPPPVRAALRGHDAYSNLDDQAVPGSRVRRAFSGFGADWVAPNSIVDAGKYNYLFGNVSSNSHNLNRSLQNQRQLNRVGVYDNAAGRDMLSSHFDDVLSTDSNIVRTWTDEWGTHQIRESVFAGPNGILKFESSWQVTSDGFRLETVIPSGGG